MTDPSGNDPSGSDPSGSFPAEAGDSGLDPDLAPSFGGRPAGMRTHWCGHLGTAGIGTGVSLCGWVARRREHGEHLAFIDLRDRTGVIQCVIDGAAEVRTEYVVRITGVVRPRPEGTRNPGLATGDVEVGDAGVEVLATADPPPFSPDDRRGDTDEVLRLRHRYLDLRRPRLAQNLLVRSRVNAAIRRAMDDQGFLEIETPLLTASTPEGARDFVVPSRLSPGNFYALPQSPQLYKQLTMVGGVDRYYQIARCLRDEDLRADRQFEFTQLDMEASFVGQEEVMAFVTEAIAAATEAATGSRPDEIGRIPWHEAMNRYGSDKPDVRFAMELVDLTATFAETGFRAFQAEAVKAIVVPGGAAKPRRELDELTEDAKRAGAGGLVWMKVDDTPDNAASITSPVAKFLSEGELAGVTGATGATGGDLVLIVADAWARTCEVLGRLRNQLGRPPVNEGGQHFLWVVDFPLFEGIGDDGTPIPAHHPFTMPHPEDIDRLGTATGDELAGLRSQAYDLTLNGWELGSGSVRIHRADIQAAMLATLGIDEAEARQRFGFLLDAFRYGAPPHAGFAFGIDRFAALLAGEVNIREAIAFPKTQSGADPLTGAPGPADPAHLAELGLRTLPKKG